MSHKRKFLNKSGVASPISGINSNTGAWNSSPGQNGSATGGWSNTEFGYKNYMSRLPEVYTGHPNRIERYNQYEMMDVDAEINACLDILSEFSTQKNQHNKTPFNIEFKDEPTNHEVELLKTQLQQWCKLNEFEVRIFKIFRNVVKYGDQVFVRDPENFKLYWVDMVKVIKVIVNESEGKKPEQYVIKDLNINLQDLTVAQKTNTDFAANPATGLGGSGGGTNTPYTVPAMPYNTSGSRFTLGQSESSIDAKHIVHISLTEGLDRFWPFGQSILENIFKVYKQKELLEDAVLIYRVQRAPERRVFKIDVGNMPSHMAMAFVERIKNEIHQRRIPSLYGGPSIVDASYNPLCLDLETKIPLLDGRTLALKDIIAEFESGKENWAYSCNPETGKVVPGIINWAGITRKNTEVIKLTFDNGKTLVCTPDHKIPVFGKGFVEAQHLTEQDSLIAFNTKKEKISNNGNDYEQIWDHEDKKWVWTHRMVGEFFRELGKHQEFNYLTEYALDPRTVIHHNDYDRFNNDPRNLVYMNKADHILYHAAQKKEFWETMTDDYRDQMTAKISSTLKENWKNMSEKERLAGIWNIRAAQQKTVWLRKNDPVTAASYKTKMQEARKAYFNENPNALMQVKKNCDHRVKIKNQPLNLTFNMLQRVTEIVKEKGHNKNKALKHCDSDESLLNMVREANATPLDYKNAQCKIDFTKFGYSKMDRLLTKFGYTNWKHFVKEVSNFNHRIVKIEKVDNRDTGTITIDGLHRWHDYHTFAIDSGIFVKNSMNEDYFFPVTSEGKGSSVELLPGGQNLGEIDDLKYFNNRLARGLRVPSSYLPTGPDDNSTPMNDGRVGTAMIQEFRFNQYCERLQNYMSLKLDEEFKLFLRWRGFNIDSGLFQLTFNPPQNFASYRQSELDKDRVGVYQTIEQFPYISKRFAMERFLGLSEEEIAKNEKLWREENQKDELDRPKGSDLRSIGVSIGDMQADQDTADQTEAPSEEGASPESIVGPVSTAPPNMAGAAAGAQGAAAASGIATPGSVG
jgi:Bacteriophage T4-like portal protein (Gp20)